MRWFCVLFAAWLAWPGAARAQEHPEGWRLTATKAAAIALAVPKVREEAAKHAHIEVSATPRLQDGRWEVSVLVPSGGNRAHEVAYALLDDRTARVQEAWTGVQIGWPMARGYPGAFGDKINAPWVWIALSVLFVAPFVRRRPSLVHLDLAVLLAFSLSYAAFNDANLGLSVPSAYPLLGYLLARTLWAAWHGSRGAVSVLPDGVLFVALVFLVGFRAAITLAGGNVIDVGYSGVIGADHLAHLQPLYGAFPADNAHGDTYGPVAYAAYVPFELVWPWSGTWDSLPAAQAAAAGFDLACIGLCFLLGRRLGGRRFGLLLAYLWAAYPFTLLVLASGANDSLVALLVLVTLLVSARPLARGAALALAGLTKFGPFLLVPVLATYRRGTVKTLAATVIVSMLVLAPFDPAKFWRRTIAFQSGRDSPFSVWGLWHLGPLHAAAELGAVALAVALAFVPRRRDLFTVCAVSAAVLLALQIALGHWFYLYLVWFLAPLWVALLAPRSAERASTSSRSASSRRPGAPSPSMSSSRASSAATRAAPASSPSDVSISNAWWSKIVRSVTQ